MRLFVLLLGVMMISGCVEDPEAREPAEEEGASAPVEEDAPDEPVIETAEFTLNWTADLARGGWICQGQVGCRAVPDDGAFSADSSHPLPVGNYSQATMTLEWSATSEVTRELVVGYRIVVPGCDDCTPLSSETGGTSPLQVTLPDGIEITEPANLQLWVYGALIQGENTSGTYAGANDDQEFNLFLQAIREYNL